MLELFLPGRRRNLLRCRCKRPVAPISSPGSASGDGEAPWPQRPPDPFHYPFQQARRLREGRRSEPPTNPAGRAPEKLELEHALLGQGHDRPDLLGYQRVLSAVRRSGLTANNLLAISSILFIHSFSFPHFFLSKKF